MIPRNISGGFCYYYSIKSCTTNNPHFVDKQQISGISIFHFTQLHVLFCYSFLVTLYHSCPKISRLFAFSTVSIPPDVLLHRFEIFTVPDLPDETAKHIWQPFNYKVAAFYIIRANLAAVELWTECARRMRINRTYSRTVFPVSAFPIVTCHYITPLAVQPASACGL